MNNHKLGKDIKDNSDNTDMTDIMDENDRDPLEELYVDKEEFNRERLSQTLKRYIGIDKETGDPVFRGNWSELDNKRKIVTYLLYRRAAVALGKIDEDNIGILPKKLAEEIGLNHNTIRSYLSQLEFAQNDKKRGGYFIPAYALEEALDTFES